MPSVRATPELITHVEMPASLTEQPQAREARPGFWRTLVHRITMHLPHTPRERQTAAYSVPRPFETPMDRLVREHPALSISALAII